jgi:hypothetical protein
LLRFILAIVTLGVVVFALVYFFSTPVAEKPATSAAASETPAPVEQRGKIQERDDSDDGEEDDDDPPGVPEDYRDNDIEVQPD